MSLVVDYLRELFRAARDGWNRFWFTPSDPATLGLIRILAGAMLLYTHVVWSLGLEAFFGAHAWVSPAAAQQALAMQDGRSYAWSYWWLIESPAALWTVHIAALVVFAMLMLGLASRIVAVLAYLAAVSYVNRLPGALFGLDQINCMLAMYLMIGPSGGAYSLDRWLAARRAGTRLPPAAPSVSGNIATRLIQIHMCVIYFFAGLGKLHGESWWYGDALWGAVANLEYQSLDVTWLAAWPLTVAVLTQVTVYWELFFCVLVWPRILRPVILSLAVPLHLGIAFFMGMITFGLAMLIGCLSFVPPSLVRRVLGGATLEPGGAGQGGAAQEVLPAARREPHSSGRSPRLRRA
ncbi:MAG TPA: HTTM domain-containing protein [Pirellulales bacterium]|nr:HTTM domain-containing protein [Pirellulales bacterium]